MNRFFTSFGMATCGAALLFGSAGTAQAAPAIDRIDITTWAYDRVEGDTYTADNNGGKSLSVYWKSFAGNEQVRSGCTSTVEIVGPMLSETKNVNGCDSYNPGTTLKTRLPGVYKVTVTVSPEGQPEINAERDVTILPRFGR